MNILKELPAGSIPSYLLESIHQQAAAEVESYAASRRNDVARGAETAELAAILVDKYGAGLAKALAIAGIDSTVQSMTDRLVREIDPEFDTHRKARWASRPAGLTSGDGAATTPVVSTQDTTGSARGLMAEAIKRGESIVLVDMKRD